MTNFLMLQRIIGDITKLFGIELPSATDVKTPGIDSKLSPTVGISFGLPNQNQGYYGGQPQNFLGTGGAQNPYPATGGISIGAVDIAPLVSFQATTNDAGELVNKPLINLHVTPNGCGLFGCEDDGYGGFQDASFPDFFGTRRDSQRPKRKQYQQLTPSPLYQEDVRLSGYQDNYRPVYQDDYRPVHQDDYRPIIGPQPQNYKPKSQSYQPNYQDQYNNANPSIDRFSFNSNNQPAASRPTYSKNPVRFSSDPVVVKHEHVHYHYDKDAEYNNNRYNDGGINFAYNNNKRPQYEGPFFRTINDTTTSAETFEEPLEEGDKEKPLVFGAEKKSDSTAFKFPAKDGKALTKRSADGQQSEEIKAVSLSFKQPPDTPITPNNNATCSDLIYIHPKQGPKHLDLLQRQHKHFGPEGYKPPTCGGPASGYVCCKVGVVSLC